MLLWSSQSHTWWSLLALYIDHFSLDGKNMQIQDHNQEDRERQNEIKRDITKKPHTLKTMVVKSQ